MLTLFLCSQVSCVSGEKASIFICLLVYMFFFFLRMVTSAPLIFSRLTMTCLGILSFVWSLLNLVNPCWCLSLILDISWPFSLQIFLLFHTLSFLLSFYDSNYMYIWWSDIILQISDDFPHSFCLFVFDLDTFHLAVFKFCDTFLLNPSNELFLILYFSFLAFHYVCVVNMFLLSYHFFMHVVHIFH